MKDFFVKLQIALSTDKALHFVYAYISTIFFFSPLSLVGISVSTSIGISCLIVILLAWAKEYFLDWRFDAIDLGVSLSGTVVAAFHLLLLSKIL